jgi:hypothetical protein
MTAAGLRNEGLPSGAADDVQCVREHFYRNFARNPWPAQLNV